jgi:AraC-like DNA-binding protein
VQHLAEIAGMGLSTLHDHFRVLTALSPLPYQKQLRSQAARGRMLIDDLDAASAGFEVWIRKRQPIQSRIQLFLRPTTDAGYSDPSLAGRCGVGVGNR